jgi:hypothetical protein
MKDHQERMPTPGHCETTDHLIREIFTDSATSLIREWTTLLIHAGIAMYPADLIQVGPSQLHVYGMLLLYERRKFPRAAATAILSSLMTDSAGPFTVTVMQCAMRAAIDGSSAVRLAFIQCVAQYLAVVPEDISDDFGELRIEEILRKSPIDWILQFDGTPPCLGPLLNLLQNDPHPRIRQIAAQLLGGSFSCDVDFQRFSMHRAAHCSLFSNDEMTKPPLLRPRYSEDLFSIHDLERFELIQEHRAPITALSFDLGHTNISIGSADGIVSWSSNKWQVTNCPIAGLVHLPNFVLVVAADDGTIHIVRDGCSCPFEMFRPSFSLPTRRPIIVGIPNTSILFYSQGTHEVFVWDLSSLQMLDVFELPAIPQQFAVVDEELFCRLENGTIVRINSRTFQIEDEYECPVDKRIVRIGQFKSALFAAMEDGEVLHWRGKTKGPRYMRGKNGSGEKVVDLLVHPWLHRMVLVTEYRVQLSPVPDGEDGELVRNGGKPVKCSFDSLWPLLAIGSADGSVAVWRIPPSKR